MIGDLGEVIYEGEFIIKSPYNTEICEHDAHQNVIRHIQDETVREYSYNSLNELILEDSGVYCEYDLAGNLIQKGETHFTYDEENRLVMVEANDCEVTYSYDAEGRRDSKTVDGETERYIHFGINEMAVIGGDGMLKEVRIPGLSIHPDILRPIAIETQTAIYAPIHDRQGNVIKLIDLYTGEVVSLAPSDPFGRGLSNDAPTSWIFSGKHYDKETGLVYFGARFYCPELKKWLTPDPLFQTPDPYQYCFNNPLSYYDPDGKFSLSVISLVWGAGIAIASPAVGAGAAAFAAGVAVGWVGYKGVQKANEWLDQREQPKAQQAQEKLEKGAILGKLERSKKGGIDSRLPKNPFNHPDWEEISHPEEKTKGHHKFKDKKTGEKIAFDKGRPGESGNKGRDHYHRFNPNATSEKDLYLDKNGNPVSKNSTESHLYPE